MTKVHDHGLAPVLSASCRASPSLGRTKAHTPSHQCSAPLLACSAPPRWAVGPLYPAQPTYLLSRRTDGSLGAGKTLVGKSGAERSETGWLRTFPCCHPPFPTLPSGHGPHSRPPPGRGCLGAAAQKPAPITHLGTGISLLSWGARLPLGALQEMKAKALIRLWKAGGGNCTSFIWGPGPPSWPPVL